MKHGFSEGKVVTIAASDYLGGDKDLTLCITRIPAEPHPNAEWWMIYGRPATGGGRFGEEISVTIRIAARPRT